MFLSLDGAHAVASSMLCTHVVPSCPACLVECVQSYISSPWLESLTISDIMLCSMFYHTIYFDRGSFYLSPGFSGALVFLFFFWPQRSDLRNSGFYYYCTFGVIIFIEWPFVHLAAALGTTRSPDMYSYSSCAGREKRHGQFKVPIQVCIYSAG